MNKALTSKILEGYSKQYPPLIDFDACRLTPKFESELQRKEYEQALLDVHACKDRRTLIHSKKGAQIVLLYMRVWRIGPQQAMRELITDEASFVCPLREPLEVQTNKVSEHLFRAFMVEKSCSILSNVFFRRPGCHNSGVNHIYKKLFVRLLVKVELCVCTGETHVK